MQKYLVGGAVRDLLLGKPAKDRDWVLIGATEEDIPKEWKYIAAKSFPVYLDENGDEVALARIDKKSGTGYKGFTFVTENVTLEEDLSRRDLTINSMAQDESGKIYDFFNGQEDLKNKILRHTTDSFREDPLRVFRIARFKAKYPDFKIAKETISLCREMAEETKELSGTRILLELKKAFEYDVIPFFNTLNEFGVLEIWFPELYEMQFLTTKSEYHQEDSVYLHSLMSANACIDMDSKLAALFHDIGKLSFFEKGNFYNHYEKEIVLPMIDKLTKRYLLSKKEKRSIIVGSIYHHLIHGFEKITDRKLVKNFLEREFPKNMEEFNVLLNVAKADAQGRLVLVDGKIQTPEECYDDKKNKELSNVFDAFLKARIGSKINEIDECENKDRKIKDILRKIQIESVHNSRVKNVD